MKFNPAPRKGNDYKVQIKTRLHSTVVEFNHKHDCKRIQAELIEALEAAGYEIQQTRSNGISVNSPYLATEIYDQLATKINRDSISLKRW